MSPPEVVTFARKTSKPYHTSHIIVTLCYTMSHHYNSLCVTFHGMYTHKLPVTNHHFYQQVLFGLIVIQLTILLPMTYPYTFHLVAFKM